MQEHIIGQKKLTGGRILHLIPLRGHLKLFSSFLMMLLYQINISKSGTVLLSHGENNNMPF